ncbi:VOC family protein [Amycolatopsis sp. K13G38]|uniref:VOC family protein n=1 Tax=Amycolatopsis acididurans TaxID=2724524 RepID=A0ABX1JEN2_9PSEU|nr:VOC family protein [Amycolatopsis acididurans]NKQ58257.1 VOC family protein [Amycolatopsis acididurans]
MTIRDTAWPEGTPCWADVMAADPKRAAEFYRALLGWEIEDQGEDYGHYLIASVEGRAAAAIGPKPPGTDVPSVWTTYLAVADADKTAAKITEAGGQLAMPPGDVGEAGRMAIGVDPTGAAFGIWQTKQSQGAGIANVPSTMVWNECMTHDFEGAKAFYAEVFGYRLDDISAEGFSYVTLNVGDQTVGGLGAWPAGVPADVPAQWITYFGVSDTDAAVAKVVELGGTVTGEAKDSPYGRLAQVTDNQGVPFSVISVPG